MVELTVYDKEKKSYKVVPGGTLLEELRKLGYRTEAPCGGSGKCGKCRAKVNGAFSAKTEQERNLPEGWRLLCSTKIEGNAEVYLDAEEKVQVETERIGEKYLCNREGGFGVAVDIGTTTVVTYLINLSNGECLAVCGDRNKQYSFGADVISRIDYSGIPKNAERLHRIICDQIESMIIDMKEKTNTTDDRIKMVVIAGNNTMELLFAGISPEPLAEYPFISPDLFGHDIPSPFHRINPQRVFLIDSIQSFVGGDITAAILASQVHKDEHMSLLLDIGTNGEMVLGNQKEMVCCAAAAGPAFEGADITCGMPGLDGAIDSVTLDQEGKLHFSTIGDKKPIGICGSGLIDLLAVLVSNGTVDETGRLLPPDEAPKEMTLLLEETEKGVIMNLTDTGIYMTSEDIRKLQLAKAAIRAGIETLIAETGIKVSDIQRFYLAGGFGCHINPESAAKIGLFPTELLNKVKMIGNGAAEGAFRVTCSSEQEKELTEIISKCQYIDLSTNSIWRDQYIENMIFE